jgi:transposase-like protein
MRRGPKTAGLAARKHGVSEATLYAWKTKYGGMDGWLTISSRPWQV